MSKKAYHHGDLRAGLLDAAERLLTEEGAAGLSLRAVAKAAGVSHTAPYRHFPNKAALLTALAARGFAELADGLAAVVREHESDPKRQLREAGRCYVVHALAKPRRTLLMFGGNVFLDGTDETLQHEGRRAFDGLQDIIEAGQKALVFRDDPVRTLALGLWSSVHGLVMLLLADQFRDLSADDPIQVDQIVDWVTEVTLNGVVRRV